jgi:hypothetical protein
MLSTARVRLGGGIPFLMMGALGLVAVSATDSAFWIAWLVVLAVFAIVVGVRLLWCGLRARPDGVELRHVYRTRRLPASVIDRCEAQETTKGLLYPRLCPVIVLTNGERVAFNLVQWSAKSADEAARACERVTALVNSGDESTDA